MAALRPCTSGHVVGARPVGIRIPSPSLRTAPSLGIGRQGSTSSLVNHRLSACRTALHPRRRHAISAHKDAASWPFGLDPDDYKPMTEEQINKFHEELNKHYGSNKDMPFREEIETIHEYWKKMTAWNASIFHMDATALSLHLCMVAKKGVKLASTVMDSAALRLDKQDEICLHTTKQTLMKFVSIFVKLAEDTYHKKFNDESLLSLLGAFRGVAAVAHILLMDALKSVNYVEYSLLDCSLSSQYINDTRHEFEQNMNNLEDKFRAALSNNVKLYELLRPTMEKAMIFTILFISMMVARHKRVLGHVPGTKGRRRATTPSEEGAPDGSETGTGLT